MTNVLLLESLWKEAEISPEMSFSYTSKKSNVRELFLLSHSSFSDIYNRFTSHMFIVDCSKIPSWNSILFGPVTSRPLHFKDTKWIMSPEMRPKSFGTFEKRAPAYRHLLSGHIFRHCLFLRDFRSFSVFSWKWITIRYSTDLSRIFLFFKRAHKDSGNKIVWLMLPCACALRWTLPLRNRNYL